MKNIFFVINKEKVYAYVVSILTIVTLFFMSHILNTDISQSQDTVANVVNSQETNCNTNIYTNEITNINENTYINKNTNRNTTTYANAMQR